MDRKVSVGKSAGRRFKRNYGGDADVEGQRDQHEQGVKQQTRADLKETCST